MHETMGIYYRELKENMPVKAVIELLATANEFADIVGSAAATAATTSSAEDALYNEIAELVKTEMATKTPDRFEKSKKYAASGALAWHYKTSILFYAHLLRVRVSDPKLKMVQAQVVLTASHLVKGMLQIAISRNWLSAACNTIELGQVRCDGCLNRRFFP